MNFILRLFLVMCLLFSVVLPGSAQTAGAINLDTLASRYEAISLSSDRQQAPLALNRYLSEASRQGDAGHEGRARTLRLYEFYNHGLTDSLFQYLPADLLFFAAHNQWTYYYSCWSLRSENLQFNNKIQTALREAEAIYEEARNREDNYGVGVAAYQIAACYQSLERYEEAVRFCREAELKLKETNNTGQLHNLYGCFGQALAAAHHYDELLAMADRWQTLWDEYARASNKTSRQLAAYYLPCHLARLRVYREKGDIETARVHLSRAHACAEGQRDIAQLLLLREEALLEELCGNNEQALRLIEQRLRLQQKLSNTLSRLDAEQMRARLLRKLNRTDEAALIYERLIEQKDSVGRRDMAAQLDEVASLYKVDQYRLETSLKKQQLLFAIVGCGLLALLVLVLVWGYYLLRRKNRILCEQLEQQARLLKYSVIAGLPDSAAETSAAVSLFEKLNEWLVNQKLYLNPELSRDMLVEGLATNKNKLTEAILSATGRTLTEYVTELRLQHALLLMEAQPDLPLSQIAEQSGFGVYSSFYRTFYKRYGVKPAEYRSFRKR